MRKSYFPSQAGSPGPLRVRVERKVRFEEVDPLGIVWHGRYAGYFEDARCAAGEKFGIGYLDFYANGVVAPIRIMHADFFCPLRFNEPFIVEGFLHWTEAARINMEFLIWNGENRLSTRGYTVQVFLDQEQQLLLLPPPFYQAFREKWRAGVFS
jgi:acyl-CoA thioester hydrolase